MFYEHLKKEYDRVFAKITSITNLLPDFPSGELYFSKNGKYYQWRIYENGESRNISKGNRELAQQMAMKKFYNSSVEKYQKKLLLLEKCMEIYSPDNDEDQLVENHPEMQELLKECFYKRAQDMCEWEKEEYEKNSGYPEQLTFKTIRGEYVRSKSEALIAMYLFHNKIPYRYECGLDIGGRKIYPDFTIKHPRTGKIIYWEHCGCMDKPLYVNDVAQKIRTYATMGIYPFENLIMTYERKDCPLDIAWVEELVKYYLLN